MGGDRQKRARPRPLSDSRTGSGTSSRCHLDSQPRGLRAFVGHRHVPDPSRVPDVAAYPGLPARYALCGPYAKLLLGPDLTAPDSLPAHGWQLFRFNGLSDGEWHRHPLREQYHSPYVMCRKHCVTRFEHHGERALSHSHAAVLHHPLPHQEEAPTPSDTL